MGLIQAIVYGIIQGLTEFIPVSSNAHIRIVPALLGWPDPGAAFTAVIQLGTVAALVLYFARDIGKAFMGWIGWFQGKRDTAEARMGWAVFVGTLPIILLGLIFKDQIETTLRSLYIIAAALIGMGVLMYLADAGVRSRKVASVTPVDGIVVGLWQCLALIPGMSRSGSTITGALFSGFDRQAAARFSFLLSVPSVAAAGIYEAYKARHDLSQMMTPIIVATLVSFAVGYAAVAFLMNFIQRKGIKAFVIYRVALGLVLLALLASHQLDPFAGIHQQAAASGIGRSAKG